MGTQLLRDLLEKGADPSARRSEDGSTPLHLASSREEPEVVRLLLEHGADVEAKDDYGRTAFQVASESECDKITELLSAQPPAHASGTKDFLFYIFCLPLTSALGSLRSPLNALGRYTGLGGCEGGAPGHNLMYD